MLNAYTYKVHKYFCKKKKLISIDYRKYIFIEIIYYEVQNKDQIIQKKKNGEKITRTNEKNN